MFPRINVANAPSALTRPGEKNEPDGKSHRVGAAHLQAGGQHTHLLETRRPST